MIFQEEQHDFEMRKCIQDNSLIKFLNKLLKLASIQIFNRVATSPIYIPPNLIVIINCKRVEKYNDTSSPRRVTFFLPQFTKRIFQESSASKGIDTKLSSFLFENKTMQFAITSWNV